MKTNDLKVVALAGGVGGAKLANGLSRVLLPEHLSVIVNTGDDFEYLGYYVCPDLDTVLYNLSGINNPITGYGLKDDTFNVIAGLEKLGQEIWFQLGDRDFATQIERTRLMSSGVKLNEVVRIFSQKLGIRTQVYPMCDEPVRTMIISDQDQVFSFQDYFVKLRFEPIVKKIVFEGVESSQFPESAQIAVESAELVIICPSNPYVSIDPILSVPGVKDVLHHKPVIAVSPLINGKAIKGPAAKIMAELGISSCSSSIAEHYQGFISGLVIDNSDKNEIFAIERCGIIPYVTNTFMPDPCSQEILASKVIEFGINLIKEMK